MESSRTRTGPHIPCIGRWILNHWTTREVAPILYHYYFLITFRASLIAPLVKNPSATRETWVQSLSWEDTLEKGMATHFSILAWRIPWGCRESDRTERLSLSTKHVYYDSSQNVENIEYPCNVTFSSYFSAISVML